jgi:hypothetical protein
MGVESELGWYWDSVCASAPERVLELALESVLELALEWASELA